LQLVILGALFAFAWVILIRPQRRRQQEQKRLLSAAEPGDEILTVGGLYGIVREIDEDDDLIVEIAEGIRVRVARRAIAAVVKPEDEDDDDVVDGEAVDEDDLDAADGSDREDSVTTKGLAGSDREDSVTQTDPADPTTDDRR
jgi:preprotein translocase subunit YajC